MSKAVLQHHVDGRNYPVQIVQRRGNKRLRLTVTVQGEVRASAPPYVSQRDIAQFVRQQADWLDAQLRQLQILPETRYETGSVHPYLGKEMRLQIRITARTRLHFTDGVLTLETPNPRDAAKLLQRFYRQAAQQILPVRTAALLPKTPWVAQLPTIRLRLMKRQWGNCAQKGHLTFNTQLIKAPPHLIDAVILHELCHLKEFNHSANFYALLESADPHWRAHRAELAALEQQL